MFGANLVKGPSTSFCWIWTFYCSWCVLGCVWNLAGNRERSSPGVIINMNTNLVNMENM